MCVVTGNVTLGSTWLYDTSIFQLKMFKLQITDKCESTPLELSDRLAMSRKFTFRREINMNFLQLVFKKVTTQDLDRKIIVLMR